MPNAGPVEQLADAPGAGSLVTITDPAGFPFNVIYNQDPSREQPPQEKIVLNFPSEKPLRKVPCAWRWSVMLLSMVIARATSVLVGTERSVYGDDMNDVCFLRVF